MILPSSLRGVKRRGNLIVYFILLVCFLFIILFLRHPHQKPLSLSPTISTDFAYDNKSFLPAIASLKTLTRLTPSKVVVVPHHLTASTLIAKGIFSLSGEVSPHTIILFSPNHVDKGNCEIISSTKSWSTPYGLVKVDESLQSTLYKSNTFCFDDKAFEIEHGIAGLLPFIKYLHPQTQIIPFAIKKYIDESNLEVFINSIQKIDSPNIAYVSSVDFSHGLSQKESQVRDKMTESLILDNKYSEIFKLKQENLDSPASLVIAMKLSNGFGKKLEIIDHQDSSFYNNSFVSVTSYFLLASSPVIAPARLRREEPSDAAIPALSLNPAQGNSVSLLFTGDVMLGRSVNTRMQKYQDYTWPFQKTSELLKKADLSVINLEGPFKTGCLPTDSGMIFCADTKSIQGLTFSGIDIANLANNHILNQGKDGLEETISLLESSNISVTGMGKPLFKTVNNTKIALIGFNDIGEPAHGVSGTSPETMKSQISLAKKEAQIVVAMFHWGNEYSKRSLRQLEMAHLAIDEGADIIIGHHPHWVQEFEEYKGKPIYYSLGNFVFDQMWSLETRKGLVVKITIEDNKVTKREEFPIIINDFGQPSLDI